ncbi:hypothetical protein BJI67_05125 [Acidihalobacter aeolianus]|uniref:Uncharacterized protein n=1 Tax=Acidihalobacter aeolianus TaxID=2792603 RepID=A0A1D8K6H4_9GAMM|nr:hypothetical protein [Acidihalobacter aeolianus]AOV16536.1 hypothetical protein BJI67_05125 [Acidihalobacter aeolianus]
MDATEPAQDQCAVCRLRLGRRPVVRLVDGAERRYCCTACASTDYLIALLRERQPTRHEGDAT